MKKLKVLHIVEALGGGVYTYFIDLTKSMGNDPYIDCTIIYSDKRSEIIPEKVKEDFHPNVKLIMIPMEKEISPLKDIKTVRKLTKTLQRIQPDIVHLHSSKISVIGRLAYLLSRSKAKLYYTPHGYAFLRKDISTFKQKLYYFIEKYSVKLFGGVTIACGDTEYEIAKAFGKSALVRNGVDFKNLKKLQKTKNDNILTIGTLGRISTQKNSILFNQIALRFPNIKFLWIGDGDLREQITAPNIEITGWFMDKVDGIRFLNEIDIYIQTSLWEGLPIAVLEAMALKKPIVASNIIGNKDAVTHEKTGYLFNNIEEACFYLQKLIANKNLREQMGENGRTKCEELFDLNKNFSYLVSQHYLSGLDNHLQKD